MANLRVFDRKVALPTWRYRTSGTIWRLLPGGPGVFVGEVRNLEAKQTSFFCVSRQTGEVLWEGVRFEEQWWIGIEAIHVDRVFFHGFSTPDMPHHKGIIVVDLFSGRVVWNNPDLRFILCVEDSLFASGDTTDGGVLLGLNYRTGELVQTCSGEVLETARTSLRARGAETPEFPAPLEAFDQADERAVTLAHKHCIMDDVVGRVEALKKADLLVFSYHERSNSRSLDGHLKNILKVLDLESGDLIFTEILNKSATSATPDSFFVLDGMLYFVKDLSSLTAVSIDELNRCRVEA